MTLGFVTRKGISGDDSAYSVYQGKNVTRSLGILPPIVLLGTDLDIDPKVLG